MFKNMWVLLIIIIGSAFCEAKQLPSFIPKCKRADPVERNKCIMERIEVVKPHLLTGIPELKLPRIEPLRIPKIEAHLGNNMALGFSIVFTDVDFYGVKDFQVNEFNMDLENGNTFVNFYIPSLKAQGKYAAKGKITLFELDSTGAAQVNLTEIRAKTNRKLSIVTRNGKEYANLEEAHDLEVNYATISLYFNDIIKNNKELSEQVNKAVNDNYPEIGKQIDFVIQEAVHSFIFGIIKKFLDEYSLDELFE